MVFEYFYFFKSHKCSQFKCPEWSKWFCKSYFLLYNLNSFLLKNLNSMNKFKIGLFLGVFFIIFGLSGIYLWQKYSIEKNKSGIEFVKETIIWDGLWKSYNDEYNNFSLIYPSIFNYEEEATIENTEVGYFGKKNGIYKYSTTSAEIWTKIFEEKETDTHGIYLEVSPIEFYYTPSFESLYCSFDKKEDDWFCFNPDFSIDGKNIDEISLLYPDKVITKRATIGEHKAVSYYKSVEYGDYVSCYAIPFPDRSKILETCFNFISSKPYHLVSIKDKNGGEYPIGEILNSIKFD